MSQIIITVSPQGETTVETQGFAGSTCRTATAALEAALGLVVRDQPTAEFFQPVAAAVSLPAASGAPP